MADSHSDDPLAGARAHACVAARTALVFPFRMWPRRREAATWEWRARFERRELPDRRDDSQRRRLWRRATGAPAEGRELDPAFRALLEEQEDGIAVSPWKTARYELERWFLEGLGEPALVVRRGGAERRIEGFTLRRIEALQFPEGSGVLVVHVDWMRAAGRGAPVTERSLGEVQEALFAARHTHGKETVRGWVFGGRADVSDGHRAALGEALHGALQPDGEPIGTAALADWLLLLSGESPDTDASPRVAPSRYALHHSVVVLERAPAADALEPLLFQLRRGYAPTHLPPPGPVDGDASLAPRANRRVGLSREGVVALSWLDERDAAEEFERNQWPSRFQGIYLWLTEHVLAERAVLGDTAYLLGDRASELADTQALVTARDDLDALVHRAARHAATFHAADCGGPSDYVAFFQALRTVFRVEEQLAELRRQLDDVQRIAATAHDRWRDRRTRRFERTLAVAGAFAIPPAVLDSFVTVRAGWDGPGAAAVGLAYLVLAVLVCRAVWRRSG